MTIREVLKELTRQLSVIYDPTEAGSIASWVIEHLTGMDKSETARSGATEISAGTIEKIRPLVSRLMKHEPIQYVLNEAWFWNMKLYVNPTVLIPRPETEELVDVLVSENRMRPSLRILDIGTGSGCIPITICKQIPDVEVWSVDISLDALNVAQRNAEEKKTNVQFREMDFLDNRQWEQLPSFDIIVSNPPYVTKAEKSRMQPNVLDYEPASALFVPEEDPLVFYRAIAEFCKTHLNSCGKIYCEINEILGNETRDLFLANSYKTEIRKDMQGKDRILIAETEC